MKKWKVGAAKAQFSNVISSSQSEPQLIYNRDQPVAAIISIDEFEKGRRGSSGSTWPCTRPPGGAAAAAA